MKVTWYGTASLLIESGEDKILIDPFLTLYGAENHPSLLSYIKEDSILITHGHYDHLASVPKIMSDSDATVYCSATPALTLEKRKVDGDQIVIIRPGDVLTFGSIKVKVLQGKHVKYDKKLIRKTLLRPRVLRYFSNLLLLGWNRLKYREAQETLIYQIEAEGKVVLVLGSLALDENTEYPQYVDMLVLPYQGSSDLVTKAVSIIERISPRTVLLDHFDDAFPPITTPIDTKPLKKALDNAFPELPVAKPTAGKAVTLL